MVNDTGQARTLGMRRGDAITAIEGALIDTNADVSRMIARGRGSTSTMQIEWVTHEGAARSGRFDPNIPLGLDCLDQPEIGQMFEEQSPSTPATDVPRNYGFARFSIGVVSALGVLAMVFGLILIIAGFTEIRMLSAYGGLFAGGGVVMTGAFYVGMAQVFGAMIDTAENTHKTNALLLAKV